MGRNWPDGGYSASVDAWFQWDGVKYQISLVGPDSFTVRELIPPIGVSGVIVIVVDGRESVYPAKTIRVDGKQVFYDKLEKSDAT